MPNLNTWGVIPNLNTWGAIPSLNKGFVFSSPHAKYPKYFLIVF